MTTSVDKRPKNSAQAFKPGDIVGSYRIIEPLSDGASGTVYVVETIDRAPAQPARVALKIIHRHLVRDRQVSRRFEREARILSALTGDHLVPLLDYGQTADGVLFMALELLEGTSLDQVIRRGPVAPREAVRIVIEICVALEAAHAAGIIHRDLKPSNVIIEQATDRVRVFDFGLAKVLRGMSDSITALTEQNMVFGTPEYMAPEQARGDEIDARCDVYAAGIILYELLTATVPFRAETPIAVMSAHLMEPLPTPSSRAPKGQLSPALEAVLCHALAKERDQRYPSAQSFADALRRALDAPGDVLSTLPPEAADTDLPYRDTLHALPAVGTRTAPSNPLSRRPWLWTALGAALLSILLGIAASLLQ